MNQLYITNNFNLKMIERGCETSTREISIDEFKEILMNKIQEGFELRFGISSTTTMENLVNKIRIPVEGNVVSGESIGSEDIYIGDVILLAAPTQSCGFRFFVITIKLKRY